MNGQNARLTSQAWAMALKHLTKNTRFNPYKAPVQKLANNDQSNLVVNQIQKPQINRRPPPLQPTPLDLEPIQIPESNI